MTVARGVALAALGLVVILVAWLLLRGDGGHEYQLVFQNAGQLVATTTSRSAAGGSARSGRSS